MLKQAGQQGRILTHGHQAVAYIAGGQNVEFAAQTAGLAIGPLLAGVAGTGRMTTLFVLATGVAVLAGVPLLGHRRALPSAAPPRSTVRGRPWRQPGRGGGGALVSQGRRAELRPGAE